MKDEELIKRRQQAKAKGLVLNRPGVAYLNAHHSGKADPVEQPVEMMHILAELGRLRRRIIDLENSVRLYRSMH